MAQYSTSFEQTARIIDDVIRYAFIRFARYGFKKTTVDEIAADVRISKRTLYIVFPSKEEILREGVWRELMPVMETFRQSLPSDYDESMFLTDFCSFMLEDRIHHGKTGLFRGLHHEDPFIRQVWYDNLKRILRDIISDGKHSGYFKPFDCDLAATTIASFIMTLFDTMDKLPSLTDFPSDAISIIGDMLRFSTDF